MTYETLMEELGVSKDDFTRTFEQTLKYSHFNLYSLTEELKEAHIHYTQDIIRTKFDQKIIVQKRQLSITVMEEFKL